MDDIRERLTDISKDIKELRVESTKNSVTLETHMLRTDLNEQRILFMERWLLGILASVLVAALIRLYLT